MTEILARALGLVLIIALGYGLKRWGYLSADYFPAFSQLVLTVTLPCALVTSFNEAQIVPSMLGLAAFAFVLNLAQQLLGYLLARHRDPVERGFAILHGGSYNIGAFALPYLSAFMGPSGMVSAALFDVGNALGSAGVGRGWAHSVADRTHRTTPLRFLRQMLSSPVFDIYLVLVALRLLQVRLPGPVITVTSLIGAANPFLAMLMIGIGLEVRLPRSKLRLALVALAQRYLWAVVLALTTWFVLPWPRETRVIVMLLLAPWAAMVSGFTSEINADVEVSTFITTVSVLVAVVMLPSLLLLLQG